MRLLLIPALLGTILAVESNGLGWTSSLNPITKFLAEFGVLGALIWYLWYVTSKDRPRIEERHQMAIDRLSAAHIEATKLLVADFREEYREQRAATKESLNRVITQMESQNVMILGIMKGCPAARQPQIVEGR